MNGTTQLSTPKEKRVRGYTIRKLPIGAYVAAISAIEDMPKEIIKACFGEDVDMLSELTKLDSDKLITLFVRGMKVVPSYMLDLIAMLTELDREAIENDRNLGLDGLMELVAAWLEVNDFENFMQAVRALSQKMTTANSSPKQSGGFSGLLRKALLWVSPKGNS